MNQLKNVLCTPTSIRSAANTTAVVSYSGAVDEPLVVEGASGFDVSPTSVTLPAAGAGVVAFDVKVSRTASTSDNCALMFTAFNKTKRVLISVKP